MSPALPAPTITPLYSYPLAPTPFPTCRVLVEAWWACRSTAEHTWRDRSDCLVSTGEPFSVVPPQLRHDLDLVVHPELAWTGPVPDWLGVPCRVGRVELWLPVLGGQPLRPFPLLALLPRQTVPFLPPYAILGTQFLVERGATLRLDCSSGAPATCAGELVIP
jgi:hypothetical protein